MFRLALAQMLVNPGRKAENLARATEMVSQAAKEGAQVVLLPEALTLGWMHPSATTLADEIPGGESFEALSKAARDAAVHVCMGLVERSESKIYNSAVLIGPAGKLLARHRKINELEIAHDLYAVGDHLQVAQTEFGKMGIMICADAFIRGQVISRSLAAMGAQVILSPCAWAVPLRHNNELNPYGGLWIEHYSPVAREFGIWIAGASSVGPIEHGPWSGWSCIGCSLVVGPNGEVTTQAPYGSDAQTIRYVDVTLRCASRPPGEPGQ